jgi:hypothetical protein
MKLLFGRFGQGALMILSLILLAPAQRADADAVFDGVADANVTLTGLSGVPDSSIIAIPITNDTNSSSTSGPPATAASLASATTTLVPPTPAVGNNVVLTTSASGTVPAPAAGTATASASTVGGLTLFNNGTADATLTFDFNYRYSILASTDESAEFADATALITLSADESIQGNIVDFSLNPAVTAANGTSQSSSSSTYPGFLTFSFTLTLSPGESASILFRSETSGQALRAIPEPSSLALCGMFSASVLATLYRKRRPLQS